MRTWATEKSVTTLRLCQTCKQETPYRICTGEGCKAYVCIVCEQRAELYQQSRD